jgi:peptide/nickel transport system substrate-binding protein
VRPTRMGNRAPIEGEMVVDHIGGNRRTRPALLATTVLVALALLATACKSSSTSSPSGTTQPKVGNGTNITVADAGTPQSGGTLNVGLNAETDGWSPINNQWAGSAYIVSGAIFDRLAEYDSNAVAQPYLAESLTPNADFTTWTIKMRPNVTFHDGEQCDAAALKIDFEAQRKSLLTGPVFATVTSIDVKDPLTLQFTMSQPWSTFADTMATQVGAIAAPKMVNSPDGGVREPIGTGPFSFVSWIPDNKLEVKKNPNYWRSGYPLLDGIDFHVLPDLSSRTAALQGGTVDMIEMGDPSQILNLTEAAKAGKIQMYTDQGLQQYETFTALNVASPPFDGPLAREILAYGTDRDTLSSTVFKGLFQPALGPFGEEEPYYSATDMPTFDPVKAKQLADQYQQKYGHQLEFSYLITPQPEVMNEAQAGQQEFKDIGVKMNIKSEDQATLITDVILGNYQATGSILFGSNTLDVNYVFIADTTVRPPGQLSLNFTRNNDPVLTQALDDARKTSDRTEQIAQYKIVQEQMAKDQNFIFLVHNLEAIAYTNNTHGLVDQTLPDGSAKQISVVPLLYTAWKS